jgi:hypothetical protein
MARNKNYKAGANRNWRSMATAQRWADRMSKPITGSWLPDGVSISDVKRAKDGRAYYLRDGKVIFIKGSKPTR